MLLKNLKNEYELRYRAMCYKQLHKRYLYSCFDKNNYELLRFTVERIKLEDMNN